MIIYSCDFVVASELFYGLTELWNAFAASSPLFSWGDNNRTLVGAVDILVAFLGYCLSVTLRMKLTPAAPGLTTRAVLNSLSAIQMMEVHLPTSDGRVLVMPRHTEPESEQNMILQALKLELPPQPPPRIRAGKVEMPTLGPS